MGQLAECALSPAPEGTMHVRRNFLVAGLLLAALAVFLAWYVLTIIPSMPIGGPVIVDRLLHHR